MCYDSSTVDPWARDATGQMNFMDNGIPYVCSGTLLNDLDSDTLVPYFLTAHHCIHSQAAADTIEVVYLWQTAACAGSLPDYFSLPRSEGATLLHSSSINDHSFLRLNGDVPGGVSLAGWTTASFGGELYGIHHPVGDYKRVTFMHEVQPWNDGAAWCASWVDYANEFDYFKVDSGMLEGGSSGSGIFIAGGYLVGQLKGADWCPSSDSPSCSNRGDWVAVYGQFDETYPYISGWMQIGGTIHVDQAFIGTEQGTASAPFRTVTSAYDLAWDGSHIKIEAGSYPETLSMTKKVTLLAIGGPVTIGR
jgi:hypothetical protein